jgi:2-polyprenyl-3-methyl-5-hydroxy-6-metoxy-1,4-benzoquinol methylase
MTEAAVIENETKENLTIASGSCSCPLCGSRQVGKLLEAPDRFHLRTERYHLARCSSCTGVWLVDPPKLEEMGPHYDEEYHNAIVAAGEGSAEERWRDQRDLIAHYKNGGNLLDLGCSSGGFLSTMRGDDWKLYGIEMEAATAEKARAATGADVFVGDVLDAPFVSNSFDVITCFDVLEHVYSPQQFLTKVKEWLKPGGIYHVMLPNIDSWEAKLFGTYWFGLELPRHLFHFSPHSLRRVMNDLNFEEVHLATPRVSYLERSLDYVAGNVAGKFGLDQRPQSKPKPRGFLWKAARKCVRAAVFTPVAQIGSWSGRGPSIEAVFRKK